MIPLTFTRAPMDLLPRLLVLLSTMLVAAGNCHAASAHEMHVGAQEEQICSASTVAAIGSFLKLDGFKTPSGNDYPNEQAIVAAAACKASPASRQTTLAAVAYDSGHESTKSLVVALLDTRKAKVVSSYRGAIEEDAAMRVASGSLWLDTAAYQLADGVRAFGLDVTSGYIPNCGDGGFGATRSLYVIEGTKIRPVLQDLVVSYWTFIQAGQYRCTGPDAPELSIIENIALTIALGDSVSNGYRDLLVTATASRDDTGKPTRKPFVYKLKYDGRKYDPRAMETSFSMWQSSP